MTTMTKRVIPADIFDTLHLSALAFGGIGAGLAVEGNGTPLCLWGHCEAMPYKEEVRLRAAMGDGLPGSLVGPNDRAVRAINARKGAKADARVSSDEYVAEMGWERGE